MTNNWKLIEILNQLKDAGLPEPYMVHQSSHGWTDINWDEPRCYFTLHTGGENKGDHRVNGYLFKTLPEAIEQLKQLLQTEGKDE